MVTLSNPLKLKNKPLNNRHGKYIDHKYVAYFTHDKYVTWMIANSLNSLTLRCQKSWWWRHDAPSIICVPQPDDVVLVQTHK